MRNPSLTRRDFLRHTSLAVAGLSLAPAVGAQRAGRVVGPNEEIRFAVVGFRGQGGSHLKSIQQLRDRGEKVRVTALCDVDHEVLEGGVKVFKDKGEEVKGYTDIRALLEDPNVDALSIATPNHWHALAAIWGVQAGLDVYVEKPVSHNVWEGRQIVEAARKYKRIVQTGTQCRSSRQGIAAGVEWVRAGNLGKILAARGLCYKRRDTIGKVDGPQTVPGTIDYDLWCGPAPKEPLMRKRLHYDWHWVWPTGNGDLGNQGIHQMDIARWALGKTTLSPMVFSIGGRLGYIDDGETANTQMVVHNYGDALLIFEVRGLPSKPAPPAEPGKKAVEVMDRYRGQSVGDIIECEGGYLSGTTAHDNDGKEIRRFRASSDEEGGHFGNFIKAVRSRKREDLNADILEGHLSSALCHTGNISYRLGKQAVPEELREALKRDAAAQETLARMEEHLAANGIDIKKTQLTIGPVLRMDPQTEKFVGNSKANALLTRKYRRGFVVPKKV